MSKVLQVSNNTVQTVIPNAFINLGTITRRVGCNFNNPTFSYTSPTTITINTPGYYELTITMDITSTAATQQMTVGIIQDGIPIASINQYATVAGEISTKARNLTIRVFCSKSISIALQNNSTADITIPSVNVNIIKVA